MNKKPDNLWDTVLEASIDDNNNLVALVKEKGSMTINIKLSHEAYLPLLIESLYELLAD